MSMITMPPTQKRLNISCSSIGNPPESFDCRSTSTTLSKSADLPISDSFFENFRSISVDESGSAVEETPPDGAMIFVSDALTILVLDRIFRVLGFSALWARVLIDLIEVVDYLYDDDFVLREGGVRNKRKRRKRLEPTFRLPIRIL
jgi:hypothetical protein